MRRALLIATSIHLLLFLLFRIEGRALPKEIPPRIATALLIDPVQIEAPTVLLSYCPSYERGVISSEEILKSLEVKEIAQLEEMRHEKEPFEKQLIELVIISSPLELLNKEILTEQLLGVTEPLHIELIVDAVHSKTRLIHSKEELTEELELALMQCQFESSNHPFQPVELEVYPVYH